MEKSLVLYEKVGHVVIITMNRPEKKNAINAQMKEELESSWGMFRDDDDAWVAILTGAGDTFSAGGDLKENLARAEGRMEEKKRPKGRAINAPKVYSDFVWEEGVLKPVIGAINGYAGGGGFALALNCDIRIASESAVFGCSAVRWSHMAGGQAYMLPRVVSLGWAFWFLYTGQTVDAETAFRIGLVQNVTQPDKLLSVSMDLAEVIARNGPLVSQYHKEYLYKAMDMPLSSSRFMERVLYEQLQQEPEYDEGTRAFIEKRQPLFDRNARK